MGLTIRQFPDGFDCESHKPLNPSFVLEYWPSMGAIHEPGLATVKIQVANRNYNRSVNFGGLDTDIIYGDLEVAGEKQGLCWAFDIKNLSFRRAAEGAVWVLKATVTMDGQVLDSIELPGIGVEKGNSTRDSTPKIFEIEIDDQKDPSQDWETWTALLPE